MYRWLIWVSTVVAMLWLCNTSTRRVSTKRIVDLLATLWIVLIFFGYLALLFPSTAVPSLLQRVTPQGVLSNQFIYDLTVVRFAELQTFVGGSVPRPAAPMPSDQRLGLDARAAHAVLHPVVAAVAVGPAPHDRVDDRRVRARAARRSPRTAARG